VQRPVFSPTRANRSLPYLGLQILENCHGISEGQIREFERCQKLLGLILDNQVVMVIVRGASGAGKTSLLQAGLTHILAEKGVKYHSMWSARFSVSLRQHGVGEKTRCAMPL